MGQIRGEQIETSYRRGKRGVSRMSGRLHKSIRNRHERRKARLDPESVPAYRQSSGWEG